MPLETYQLAKWTVEYGMPIMLSSNYKTHFKNQKKQFFTGIVHKSELKRAHPHVLQVKSSFLMLWFKPCWAELPLQHLLRLTELCGFNSQTWSQIYWSVGLRLSCASELSYHQSLMQSVGQEFTFLTSSQVLMMLLVWELHFQTTGVYLSNVY